MAKRMITVTQIQSAIRYCADCGAQVGRYGCETCNSKYFATTIQPRICPIDGGKIRPAADRMTGMWWMLSSHQMTWRCDGCSFVGTFADFANEVNQRDGGASCVNEDAGNAAGMRHGKF